MTEPENTPSLTHKEAIAHLAVDMPEVEGTTPDAVNEAESSRGTGPAPQTETTTEEPTATPPHPDHLAFLKGLPVGEFGFNLTVYADRVEEDGLLDAAHVLRHHDAYLQYPKRLIALHRAICAEIERVFGCRYAPSGYLSDSPQPRTFPDRPHHLYIREGSLSCFDDWPTLPDGTSSWDKMRQAVKQFDDQIYALSATGPRDLILWRRAKWYEV